MEENLFANNKKYASISKTSLLSKENTREVLASEEEEEEVELTERKFPRNSR